MMEAMVYVRGSKERRQNAGNDDGEYSKVFQDK
jgi:hypothetical protein